MSSKAGSNLRGCHCRGAGEGSRGRGHHQPGKASLRATCVLISVGGQGRKDRKSLSTQLVRRWDRMLDPRFLPHTERSVLEILSRWFPGQEDTFGGLNKWQGEGCNGHRVIIQPAEPAWCPGGCGPCCTHLAFKLLVGGIGPHLSTDRWVEGSGWRPSAGPLRHPGWSS